MNNGRRSCHEGGEVDARRSLATDVRGCRQFVAQLANQMLGRRRLRRCGRVGGHHADGAVGTCLGLGHERDPIGRPHGTGDRVDAFVVVDDDQQWSVEPRPETLGQLVVGNSSG